MTIKFALHGSEGYEDSLRIAGGKGSGWTAEEGHVPGSQGGSGSRTPKDDKVHGKGRELAKFVHDKAGTSKGNLHNPDAMVDVKPGSYVKEITTTSARSADLMEQGAHDHLISQGYKEEKKGGDFQGYHSVKQEKEAGHANGSREYSHPDGSKASIGRLKDWTPIGDKHYVGVAVSRGKK